MKFWVAVISMLLSNLVLGQSFDMSKKVEGVVITGSDSLDGEIVMSSDHQSIYFTKERSIRQMGATQIDRLILNTPEGKTELISLKTESNDGPYLFDVLADGHFTLLFRSLESSQYFVSINDKAVPVSSKDFYKVFGKEKKVMKDYVFSHNLDTSNQEDLIQVFEYYNQNLARGN